MRSRRHGHRVLTGVSTLSGSMDSVQVTDGGRFEFVVDTGADSAGVDVYFASIRYQGLLYFGAPVTGAADLVEAYVVRAYPSVGATPDTRLPVRVRNVFVEKAEPGPGWLVTDVFEVENGMEVSVVASEEAATWSHALPPGAFAFSVGRSDLAPEGAPSAAAESSSRPRSRPGNWPTRFHYQLPEDRFTLPMEGAYPVHGAAVREPAGELTVHGPCIGRSAGAGRGNLQALCRPRDGGLGRRRGTGACPVRPCARCRCWRPSWGWR